MVWEFFKTRDRLSRTKRKIEKDDNRKEMSTKFQKMESRQMSGVWAQRRRQNTSMRADDFACACAASQSSSLFVPDKLQRLRYQTYQVPLEVQMQSRIENRTGSNSIWSEHKPLWSLPGAQGSQGLPPIQPLPPPSTPHLNSRKEASSPEGLNPRHQVRLKARVREIKWKSVHLLVMPL